MIMLQTIEINDLKEILGWVHHCNYRGTLEGMRKRREKRETEREEWGGTLLPSYLVCEKIMYPNSCLLHETVFSFV